MGLGCILAHYFADGIEQPIGFDSQTLTECQYAQVNKEALVLVFSVKNFHSYLYGRIFTIYSNHKPLMYLFHISRVIPPLASPRVQHWALTLSAYVFSITLL